MEGKPAIILRFRDLVRRWKKSTKFPAEQESPTEIQILPPELEESILERISDSNTLLRCRLVCRHWKQFVDNMLENQRLLLLANYDPSNNINTYVLSPYVCAVCPSKSYTNKLILPPALQRKNMQENPFPHKSLVIESVQSPYWQEKRSFSRQMVDMEKFIKRTGRVLTSLVLVDVKLRQNDLSSILEATPFLKSILFSGVSLKEQNCVMMTVPNISPDLTHLSLVNCSGKQLKGSFLPLISNQLVSFALSKDTEYLSLEKKSFQNLRKLCISNLVENLKRLLEKTEFPPPLEHLALTLYLQPAYIYKDRKGGYTKVLVNFISKISTSLTYLKFDVRWNDLQKCFKETGLIFPNVAKVKIMVDDLYVDWDELSVQEVLLLAFPKLDSVKFLNSKPNIWGRPVLTYEGVQFPQAENASFLDVSLSSI